LIEAIDEGVSIHGPDGTLQAINHRGLEILGVEPTVLSSGYPEDPGITLTHEDGAPLNKNELPVFRTLSTKKVVRRQIVGMKVRGREQVWLSVNAAPLGGDGNQSLGGVAVTFRDVTQETVYRTQIEGILGALDSAVMVSDLDTGELLYQNHVAHSFFGRDVGDPCRDASTAGPGFLRPECRRAALIGPNGTPSPGTHWQFEHGHNGSWFQAIAKAIPWDSRRWARLVIASDVTAHKHHELELENLLVEMNHRVKNNLAQVVALANIEAYAEAKDKATSIADIVQRVRAIGLLHETLYQTRSFSEVELLPYLESLLSALLADSSVYGGVFSPAVSGDSARVNSRTATRIGLIVVELATNSLKYAGVRQPSTLDVLVKTENGVLEMVYRDHGSGLGPNIRSFDDLPPGTGVVLIQALVSDLEGTITLNPEADGAEFVVRFPL
jgi:two-component sensor histidine kinase